MGLEPRRERARVACIGECMVELREISGATLRRAFGGDTLNTALYLARLGIAVDYVTALGDDPWSEEMLQAWRLEGIGTGLVVRLPGRLPGLYIIQTDSSGERRFLYWRDRAAARDLIDHLDVGVLQGFEVLYLSGITLSIYAEPARMTLLHGLDEARRRGAHVVFDTNFRARSWPDIAVAKTVFRRMFAVSDTILASMEDLRLLFGQAGEAELLACAGPAEIVLKLDRPAVRVLHDGQEACVEAGPVASVVDTTAAGDSFAAAYLAARLGGAAPAEAAAAGHRLAGVVVGHPGAIIPRQRMPPSPRRAGEPPMTPAPSIGQQLQAVLAIGRVIPVITLHRLEHAVPLARALVAAGIRLLEITLRTEAGLAGAQAILREVPEAVVGIGTVLTADDLHRAEDSGARFALSPGATPALLDAAARASIPFLPGVATASEVMEAMARGFAAAKLFPATAAGGLSGLRALAGPFPAMRFCPTGGITEDNAAEWLAEPTVIAVGGSWLTPSAEVSAGDWARIEARARQTSARLSSA